MAPQLPGALAERAVREAERELEEVRLAARRFREAVLAALGWRGPWDITVISQQQIVTAIAAGRADTIRVDWLAAQAMSTVLLAGITGAGFYVGAPDGYATQPSFRAAIDVATAMAASRFTQEAPHDDHAAPATEPVPVPEPEPEPDADAAPPNDGGGEGRGAAMDGGD